MSQKVVNVENSQVTKTRGQDPDMTIFRLREMHQLVTVNCMTLKVNSNLKSYEALLSVILNPLVRVFFALSMPQSHFALIQTRPFVRED